MSGSARYPSDHEPAVEVLPAVGRFADVAAVVGTQRPGARGCWCMAYRDSRVPVQERPDHLRRECDSEPGPGVVVHVDGVVAGWCSIAPRPSYRRLMNSRTIPLLDEELEGAQVWAAVCFVVRAGHRGHGLMHRLLDGAVAHATASGARVVQGYPVEAGASRVDVISGYVGTVTLFERAGFSRAAPTTGHSGGRQRWVMRKELTGPVGTDR